MRLHNGLHGLRISFVSLLLLSSWAFASKPTALSDTQNKMQKMNRQIAYLEKSLSKSHNQVDTLNGALAEVEKQISTNINQLQSLQHAIDEKQHHIKQQQTQIHALENTLKQQQDLLKQHVNARYKTHEFEPLKWLLTQNDPYAMNRLLTYYHYLIRARITLMDDIKTTKTELDAKQHLLENDLAQHHTLKAKTAAKQDALAADKAYQTLVIQKLQAQIQSNEQQLRDYQKNRRQLLQLLQNLNQNERIITTPHTAFARHKLPSPIPSAGKSLQAMNQGVAFFAREGTPVRAVYPGKVVFSDWLKGYGLLLIIDHGHGFMTLYAHNQSLTKGKGEHVMQGEHIASVGHSGGIKQNGLYFEVRHKGKALSPLEWLA